MEAIKAIKRALGFSTETPEEREKRLKELRRNVKMTEHQEELNDLLARLNTNISRGLTVKAAEQRLHDDGENMLTPPPETPAWLKFLEEMTGFFSLLLWLGSALCFVGYGVREDLDNLYLGIVLAVVVFVTGCFSYYQNSKADSLMKSFKKLLPPAVTAVRDGKEFQVESQNLVKGDIVRLVAGDLVPADVRVIECSDDLSVDNAAITGESEPQSRKSVCTDEDPLETKNLMFFGTQIPEGSCTGVIIQTGDHTFMGRIASLAMSTDNEETPIAREIERFVKIISVIAIILGITFFAIGVAIGTDIITNLVFMIGIIVANVPEGLLATVTVSLTLTAKRMHSKMVLVKKMEGVETLGSTSCICSDKTGTLTQNIMTVAQIVYGDENGFAIQDCESSFTRGNKTYDQNNPSFAALQRCATLCNISSFDERSKFDKDNNPIPFFEEVVQGDGSILTRVAWKPVGNASECAMIKFCQPMRDVVEYRESNPIEFTIPFNSKNKYQVHVHCQENWQHGPDVSDNDGPRVVLMKGAPERVLARCQWALLNGTIVPMTDELEQHLADLQTHLSENGLRVLGFAEAELDPAQYPPGFDYNDGKDEGYSTPNFPLGEFRNQEERRRIEAQDPEKFAKVNPIHPSSVQGLVFLGMMALIDPPRPAVPPAVAKCKTAGIKVIMVTGDHPVTAEAIAYKVGILWSKTRGKMIDENERFNRRPGDVGYQDPDDAKAIVVPGHEIDADMGEERWDFILEHPQIVFARTSPQQKLVIVENCQRTGHIVAVTGDGVNDSPALKKADIGIAMGITGSEVSKTAADMILLDDNFASIVAGVEEGRLIFDNLKKSICYTLTSNIPEISPFLCFITLRTPLPLSTVLILGIDLGTDMVPAISMAYEDAEADIMLRPPRNAEVDRLVTSKLVTFAYLQIGMMQAAAGFYTWMVVLNDYGYPPHILQGLGFGDYWGKQALHCKFDGGQYVDVHGFIDTTRDPSVDAPSAQYPFWDRGASGRIVNCDFPIKNLAGGSGSVSGFDSKVGSTYDSGKTQSTVMVTVEAIQALEEANYFQYLPWRGRMSPFWENDWLSWDITDSEAPGGGLGGASDIIYFGYQQTGLWSICLADPDLSESTSDDAFAYSSSLDHSDNGNVTGKTFANCNGNAVWTTKQYKDATFCNGLDSDANCASYDDSMYQVQYCTNGCGYSDCYKTQEYAGNIATVRGASSAAGFSQCQNIASRMVQKEALHHAQGAFFVSIVIVQWADLLICKTRWLSIRQQGLRNYVMNFGLFFETLLAAWMCYCPPINVGLGTRNIRLTHWMPGMPWSMLIFMYDEIRKYLMRATSPEIVDKSTGQVTRKPGFIEAFTYY
jgi:sodium/potassium-transporting ATPase subunit alpha